VWLVGHVINVLILISPFGPVDAALKSLRTSVIGLLVVVHHINPWAAALLSIVIIVSSYFLSGWSFRLMVFGWVFAWDFMSRRSKRFKPAVNGNWMFTACRIERTPVRSYGKLVREPSGQFTFEYRPWLVMQKQIQALPNGTYAVGRGLFYPDLMLVAGEKAQTLMSMSPRYKGHEDELAHAYQLAEVRDTGLLKGLKSIWRWLTRDLFGDEAKQASAPVS
jgi:hypothetical protein